MANVGRSWGNRTLAIFLVWGVDYVIDSFSKSRTCCSIATTFVNVSGFQSTRPPISFKNRSKTLSNTMSQSSAPVKPTSQFDTGLKIRKEVVGEHYVNGALARGSTEFAYPMQELVTEWCWGDIWNRPGLDRKQRSLLSEFTPMRMRKCNQLDKNDAAIWLTRTRPWHVDCPQKLARGWCACKRSYQQWFDGGVNQGIHSTIRSLLWSTCWPRSDEGCHRCHR
jgi:hypothetical protein